MQEQRNGVPRTRSFYLDFLREPCELYGANQLKSMKKPVIPVSALLKSFMILFSVTACMKVGPDYRRPETTMPASWGTELKPVDAAAAKPDGLARWWRVFKDPLLSELVTKAELHNRDLQQARGRVREARARRGLAQANLFPTITANVSASRIENSEEAGLGGANELYANSFDAGWEVDVFGKKRREIESADAGLQASVEDLRDVLVSLYAEVALNYVEVRSFQARLAITESNLVAQDETYQITLWRYQAGLTTQLDVEQAKLNRETTRSGIPTLRSGMEQAKQRLAILLGQPPAALTTVLDEAKPIPVTPLSVAVGIPADLLRQRPDVRRAERRLAAQTAQIGVAKAARYPNLSLSGSIGLESLAFGTLYTAGAKMAQLAASSALTLFDAGRIRKNIEIQTALQDQALGLYEAAVLAALKDVENALVAYAQEQTRRDTLQDAVKAGQQAVELAEMQYRSGINDFQPVLSSQKSLLTVQTQLAASDAEVASNLIRLYKALGGGWTLSL